MNVKEINQFKANATREKETMTFMDVLKMVQNEEITPITDEMDNIIGVNYHTGVTGAKCMKVVNGIYTIGNTEEERQEDQRKMEEMLNLISRSVLQEWMEECLKLKAAGIIPDGRMWANGYVYYKVIKDHKVYDSKGNVVIDYSDKEMSDEVADLLLTEAINGL